MSRFWDMGMTIACSAILPSVNTSFARAYFTTGDAPFKNAGSIWAISAR